MFRASASLIRSADPAESKARIFQNIAKSLVRLLRQLENELLGFRAAVADSLKAKDLSEMP